MLGGSVAQTNTEIYAGLRATTTRNWQPDIANDNNCSIDWATTSCPRIAVVTASAASSSRGLSVFSTDSLSNPLSNYSFSYFRLFERHGFSPKHISAHIDNFATDVYAGNPAGDANIAIVNQADIIFFNGGDQSRAARTFLTASGADTPLMAIIRRRVERGQLVMAGTSAGTMLQGQTMYGEGSAYGYIHFNGSLAPKSADSESGLRNDLLGPTHLAYWQNGGKMPGFGFAGADTAIDTHCNKRGRVIRNIVAMKSLEKTQGICVDEDTALYLDGSVGTVYGSHGVTLVDSSTARFEDAIHFKISGAKLTYLTSGDSYDFSRRQALSSKPLIVATDATDATDATTAAGQFESANILAPDEITRAITQVVGGAAAQQIGSAPAPNLANLPEGVGYAADAKIYRIKFYKNENTVGYAGAGKTTAVNVLVDID
ncbi:hypothetical protein BH11PSE10_BH11PSE10_04540 [soil metagenome]